VTGTSERDEPGRTEQEAFRVRTEGGSLLISLQKSSFERMETG